MRNLLPIFQWKPLLVIFLPVNTQSLSKDSLVTE
jgi:hypothetical protein